jgi:drug/metabolite transporter (DMT)-like permease
LALLVVTMVWGTTFPARKDRRPRGDTLALLGALSFGLYIKMMETRTQRAARLMTLTAAQIATVALCAALWVLARDVAPLAGRAGASRAALPTKRRWCTPSNRRPPRSLASCGWARR